MIRRDFLKTSALALVGAGVGPIAFFSSSRSAFGAEADHSKARFEALLNEWFYVDDDAHPTLELIRVDDGPRSAGLEQFTAVFRGDPDSSLTNASHRLMTSADSPMELHLSPAGGDDSGRHYAAQFALRLPLNPGACAPAPA